MCDSKHILYLVVWSAVYVSGFSAKCVPALKFIQYCKACSGQMTMTFKASLCSSCLSVVLYRSNIVPDRA